MNNKHKNTTSNSLIFKMSLTDGLSLYGKIPCGWQDKNNTPLYLGNTVELAGDKWIIGYRYGKFVLIPPTTYCYCLIEDTSALTKANEVIASPDQYLIIGHKNESLYLQLLEMKGELSCI